jgi:hypothetical protein
MAASGGLAARKTHPDDQPTKIPTETDDTRTAGGQEGAQEGAQLASWPQKADASAVIEFISSSVNESGDIEPPLRQTGGALHAIPLSPHSPDDALNFGAAWAIQI